MDLDQSEKAQRLAQARVDGADGAGAARMLLRSGRAAALSTLSVRRPGWPAVSLVHYVVSRRGQPLLLLSDLAQHTRNVLADPRACLFVFDATAAAVDPRTAPRLAVYGRVVPVASRDERDAREDYLAGSPGARGLMALDFRLYAFQIEEAQWVGGFATAGWIDAAELLR
jgi:heme oxygenase (biliverdin-IX-beta and delta-forming)